MVMGVVGGGENLHPPFSSPVGLNETAQDFPTSQGKSEWTADIKWHQTNVSDQGKP